MGSPVTSYSDLPPGGVVYSDLPPGATLAPKQTVTPPAPAQPGFFENLGHAFGIGSQEAQAQQQQEQQHPILSLLEAAGGPAYQAIKGVLGGAMRSTGELGQAVDSARAGNSPGAISHTINAVPIIGPALQKMDAEASATHPGDSWATQFASGATPGNIGTAVGAAAQVAPLALSGLDAAAPGHPTIPNPPIGSAIRTAAIGDPDVPLTRALGITARTKTGLSTLQAAGEASPEDVSLEEAQGARPYGQGAKNLADLQDKLTAARTEINAPLNTALDVTANRPVMGPDGPTTISDLESQRSELSAQLRGLQQKDPLAVQTALQKGLGEADLKAKYNAIVDAMTPVLDSTGIDSRGIRMQDAQVASIYSKVAGRTTLPEQPQNYGLGKLQDLANFGGGTSPLDLFKPAKTAGSAIMDILAGRPIWSGRPTDVNIQQGFSSSGPKPYFGTPSPNFQQPPLQLGQGAPVLPEQPLQNAPPPAPAINIAPDTRAARLGLLLKAPPIELPGAVAQQSPPPTYAGSAASRSGRLLPASTDEQNIPLSEKVDIFPNQLPGAKISPRLAQILQRTGR